VNEETTVPADILLINGSCIVNEAMLSGESTPLLKESTQVLEPTDKLDVDGQHKIAVLFSGTKILQASKSCTSSRNSKSSGFSFLSQLKFLHQFRHPTKDASVLFFALASEPHKGNLLGL